MMELTIFGLMGLATMLVITFSFAYPDEFSPLREQFSLDPDNKAHPHDSPAIKAETCSPTLTCGQVEGLHV